MNVEFRFNDLAEKARHHEHVFYKGEGFDEVFVDRLIKPNSWLWKRE